MANRGSFFVRHCLLKERSEIGNMKEFLIKRMAIPTVVLIWAATYYKEVMGLSEKNHRMICPIFWVMVILYVINGISDYLEWKQRYFQTKSDVSLSDCSEQKGAIKMGAIIMAMAAYVILLNPLGFLIGTFLFSGTVLFLMGERKWYKLIGIPLLLTVCLYVVFGTLLAIPLPPGLLKI